MIGQFSQPHKKRRAGLHRKPTRFFFMAGAVAGLHIVCGTLAVQSVMDNWVEELVFRDLSGEVVEGEEAAEQERGLEVTLLPPYPTGGTAIFFGSMFDDCLMKWTGPDWSTCLRPDGQVLQNGEFKPEAGEFWRLLAAAFPAWKAEACGELKH